MLHCVFMGKKFRIVEYNFCTVSVATLRSIRMIFVPESWTQSSILYHFVIKLSINSLFCCSSGSIPEEEWNENDKYWSTIHSEGTKVYKEWLAKKNYEYVSLRSRRRYLFEISFIQLSFFFSSEIFLSFFVQFDFNLLSVEIWNSFRFNEWCNATFFFNRLHFDYSRVEV